MRHEPSHGDMVKDLHLRRPQWHKEPCTVHPLDEPVGQISQRVGIGSGSAEVGRAAVLVVGVVHHQEEPLPARLQPSRQLGRLRRGQRAAAAEGHVQDRAVRLVVQPP
uniref:Uncharacterized protein n=1 Tax=Triticum urartu TaxID=4572 RepID=A0A8R7V9Z3_TRIUA